MEIPGTKQINIDVEVPQEGELFYFCIRELNSATYLNTFVENISSHLPEFVFSRDNLQTHQDRYDHGMTTTTPLERARDFLKRGRSQDSGEFGEFLLYLFAKKVKGAHKLATKMDTRPRRDRTIPGRDNTFAWKDEDGEIYMLVGEAKTTPDPNGGLRNAQQDLNSFWNSDDFTHELNLASTNIRSEMDQDNLDIYEAYFIDDNTAHQNLRYKNVVFVGYNLDALGKLASQSLSEEDFETRVQTDMERCFQNQKTLIENCPHSSIYCFLPFESIDAARTAFTEINGLNT